MESDLNRLLSDPTLAPRNRDGSGGFCFGSMALPAGRGVVAVDPREMIEMLGDSSLNSTIPELPGSGWLAAEPEATPQTHRLRPWSFPTVSPSHPSVFPHHGIQRITVEFSEKSRCSVKQADRARFAGQRSFAANRRLSQKNFGVGEPPGTGLHLGMSPIPGRGHALHKPRPRGECPSLPPKSAQTAWQVVFSWSTALLNPQQAHGSFRPA